MHLQLLDQSCKILLNYYLLEYKYFQFVPEQVNLVRIVKHVQVIIVQHDYQYCIHYHRSKIYLQLKFYLHPREYERQFLISLQILHQIRVSTSFYSYLIILPQELKEAVSVYLYASIFFLTPHQASLQQYNFLPMNLIFPRH